MSEAPQVKFDITKVKKVLITDISPNEYNPKDKDTVEYQIIREGIEKEGMLDLIFVRHKSVENNVQKYEIVDGEQRWSICTALGYKELVIYDWEDLDLITAQQRTLLFQKQVPMNVLKLAKLVKSMKEVRESIFLPFTDREMQSMVSLTMYQFKDLTKDVKLTTETMMKTTNIIISCTFDQARIIRDAMEAVKQGNQDISDARALELICADFLAGFKKEGDK